MLEAPEEIAPPTELAAEEIVPVILDQDGMLGSCTPPEIFVRRELYTC